MHILLALPGELVMISGSEHAMHSLLCTRGGEIETKSWRSACSAYCLHPQMRTFQKLGDYFSLSLINLSRN